MRSERINMEKIRIYFRSGCTGNHVRASRIPHHIRKRKRSIIIHSPSSSDIRKKAFFAPLPPSSPNPALPTLVPRNQTLTNSMYDLRFATHTCYAREGRNSTSNLNNKLGKKVNYVYILQIKSWIKFSIIWRISLSYSIQIRILWACPSLPPSG